MEDDLPPFEIEKPEAPAVPKAADPAPEVKKAKEAPPAKEMTPDDGLDNWIDVLELITKEDGATGGFLAGSFAVRDDAARELTVYVQDEFLVMMLNNDETLKLISRCAAKADPKNAGLAVTFEVKRPENKQKNEIDDILG